MNVRLALLAASLTLGAVNVEAAPIFGSTYVRTVESVGLGACAHVSTPRRLPKHLPTPSWARQAPSHSAADESCSQGRQNGDAELGAGADDGSDRSSSADLEHSGGGALDRRNAEQDSGLDHSDFLAPQLPLDLGYDYSLRNRELDTVLGNVDVVVDREIVSVPEPSTLMLLAAGLLGGLVARRRQR
jgi:hypothetical protein